jgi:hypothetical protein
MHESLYKIVDEEFISDVEVNLPTDKEYTKVCSYQDREEQAEWKPQSEII